MIRAAYDKVIALSAHRQAEPILAGVAFVESSFFPIPPDAMLIPMILARPDRAWHIAAMCTVASVVGGMLGYAIGVYAYQSFGHAVIAFYGLGDDFQAFRDAYQHWGLWIILIKGHDADSLQDRDHRERARRLRFLDLRRRLGRDARRALLPGGGAAAHLWRADPPFHREASDLGDHRRSWPILVGGFVAVRYI